jgi:radical SAM/Cys-rich protein
MYPADNIDTNRLVPAAAVPFRSMLAKHGLHLTRAETTTLQVNVGLLCNQACHHCHLDAGPWRKETMGAGTIGQVRALARKFPFQCIDITGGAPEMNLLIADLLTTLFPLTPRLMLRSNLTAIADGRQNMLIDLCKKLRVVIVASFPSLNQAQADAQRGQGIFQKSLATLMKLNAAGYGRQGSGLELNLVANPAGAFLPADQRQTEKRYRAVLRDKWGIDFNNLFTFANVPLGRFCKWLIRSDNYEMYMEKLAAAFNPCAINGLMCRSLISVSWDGYLYDCDFNQAVDLYWGDRKTHISQLAELPQPGTPIAVADHCYTCAAGAGFT